MTPTDRSAPWSRLRLRQSAAMRDLVAETTFAIGNLIQPLFVVDGMSGREAIPGLGDNDRLGLDAIGDVVKRDVDAGVKHFLLFSVPTTKSETSVDHVKRAVEAIKKPLGDQGALW